MKHLALSLALALSVVGCAAEDTSETSQPSATAGAADSEELAAPAASTTQEITNAAEPVADEKRLSAVCAACGPLPDPWRELSGPLPDPWKAMSASSAK